MDQALTDGRCRRLVAAFDNHDCRALEQACAPHCSFERGDGNPLRGPEVLEALANLFARCPDARLGAVRMRGFPARQVLVEGFVEGSLATEGGSPGRPVKFSAGVVLHFNDNETLDRVALHVDTAAAAAQLSGAGPRASDASLVRALAERYSRAWSSQDPRGVAACFAEEGFQIINGGTPAVGREALAGVALSFMRTFPDLVIRLDAILTGGDQAVFNWTLIGTPVGADGGGKPVRLSGMEVWDLGTDGLIASSRGYFDTAAYARQLIGE